MYAISFNVWGLSKTRRFIQIVSCASAAPPWARVKLLLSSLEKIIYNKIFHNFNTLQIILKPATITTCLLDNQLFKSISLSVF